MNKFCGKKNSLIRIWNSALCQFEFKHTGWQLNIDTLLHLISNCYTLASNEASISFNNFPRSSSRARKWATVVCFSFTFTREGYTPATHFGHYIYIYIERWQQRRRPRVCKCRTRQTFWWTLPSCVKKVVGIFFSKFWTFICKKPFLKASFLIFLLWYV